MRFWGRNVERRPHSKSSNRRFCKTTNFNLVHAIFLGYYNCYNWRKACFTFLPLPSHEQKLRTKLVDEMSVTRLIPRTNWKNLKWKILEVFITLYDFSSSQCYQSHHHHACSTHMAALIACVQWRSQRRWKGWNFTLIPASGGPFLIRTIKYCNLSPLILNDTKPFTGRGGSMPGLQWRILSLRWPIPGSRGRIQSMSGAFWKGSGRKITSFHFWSRSTLAGGPTWLISFPSHGLGRRRSLFLLGF